MAGLLLRAKIAPAYSQITFADRQAVEYPEWETESPVDAHPDCVAVATQRDLDGDVEVEVQSGSRPDGSLNLIYDGSIDISSGEVEVGSVAANDLRTLSVATGRHRLRIYADQPGIAGRVAFRLDG